MSESTNKTGFECPYCGAKFVGGSQDDFGICPACQLYVHPRLYGLQDDLAGKLCISKRPKGAKKDA